MPIIYKIKEFLRKNTFNKLLAISIICAVYALTVNIISDKFQILSPVGDAISVDREYEVFGFAPYWTINKLDNVDYNVLTTLAYFGIPINANGSLDKSYAGYKTFESSKATEIFNKAHAKGTRVVLTITQMDNATIRAFLDDERAQARAIAETVALVKERGLDGINIDIEYTGTPGGDYREKFTSFVEKAEKVLHSEVSGSHLSVSVYASSAKDAKLYDIGAIADKSDAIFMMAYDFATAGSDHAIPTSPLYGYKEGEYWYDVSTAVEDFLKVMPADKLILGLPWYGYNYPVVEPGVKVARNDGYYYHYWRNWRRYSAYHKHPSSAQTYASAMNDIVEEMSGWDEHGQVGWKAYREDGVWRMIFVDDERSLRLKYQFAKDQNLGGVGMWALGFDSGKTEMWSLLNSEFGVKIASRLSQL